MNEKVDPNDDSQFKLGEINRVSNINEENIQSQKHLERTENENYLNNYVTEILNQYNKNIPFDINFPGFHMQIKDLSLIKKTVNRPTLINNIIINKYDYSLSKYKVQNLTLGTDEFQIILDFIHLSISLTQISLGVII